MSTFVYLPIFFGIVAWEFKFTNYITPEMTAFPKRKFLFMGLFDALSGICMLFGGIHTSGSFQALLLNAVIPFTMAMSIIFLKTKYLKTQYAGALVIMAGVAVVIVPTIVNGGSSDNSVVFNLIFLLSTLPQAFSSIYKELAFGDIDLDVNYLVSQRAAEMVRRTGL
jgi:drug/metabolite transporter (DMT)-like permease